MTELAPFIVLGLANGAMYGLAGIGLVLTYKTSGIFNFAHGVVAALGAFSFYQLRDIWGLPWLVALAGSVLVVGPAVGLVLGTARPPARSTRPWRAASSPPSGCCSGSRAC